MSNYPVWTHAMLTERWLELRRRLGRAKDRQQLLSIWGEIEVVEAELDERFFGQTATAEWCDRAAGASGQLPDPEEEARTLSGPRVDFHRPVDEMGGGQNG